MKFYNHKRAAFFHNMSIFMQLFNCNTKKEYEEDKLFERVANCDLNWTYFLRPNFSRTYEIFEHLLRTKTELHAYKFLYNHNKPCVIPSIAFDPRLTQPTRTFWSVAERPAWTTVERVSRCSRQIATPTPTPWTRRRRWRIVVEWSASESRHSVWKFWTYINEKYEKKDPICKKILMMRWFTWHAHFHLHFSPAFAGESEWFFWNTLLRSFENYFLVKNYHSSTTPCFPC